MKIFIEFFACPKRRFSRNCLFKRQVGRVLAKSLHIRPIVVNTRLVTVPLEKVRKHLRLHGSENNVCWLVPSKDFQKKASDVKLRSLVRTGELGYDRPLYDGLLHMTDDMLGPSPMHIKYSSYVYDGFCII